MKDLIFLLVIISTPVTCRYIAWRIGGRELKYRYKTFWNYVRNKRSGK